MSYPPEPPTGPEDPAGPPPPPPYGSQPPPPYGNQPPAYPPYGSPPPAYPPGAGDPQGYGQVAAGNQKALWALILGIVGLLCCGLASIAAVVLGSQAKKEIESSGGAQTGAGQAQAGFILGIIGCALWALMVVLYVGLFAARVSTG